jgi:hypothetical protein
MGLLDEAIREHLELKRRRGADPSAIAREEREVLEPVSPDEHAGSGGGDGHPTQETSQVAAEVAPAGAVPVDDDHPRGHDRLADLSPVGQETAELDMRAVLDEDRGHEDHGAADGAPSVGTTADGTPPAPYAAEAPAEDLLEWEIASERDHESAPEDVPGQERLSFE